MTRCNTTKLVLIVLVSLCVGFLYRGGGVSNARRIARDEDDQSPDGEMADPEDYDDDDDELEQATDIPGVDVGDVKLGVMSVTKPTLYDYYEDTTELDDEDTAAQEDFATFEGCEEEWPKEYPQCNKKKNRNLSPININTTNAILSKHVQALMIYSDSPKENLYRLKYFNEETRDSPIVDALTIHLGKDSGRELEATYVAGLGDASYRFLQRAMILFGKRGKDFGPNRSLHQINGRKFPMEIVMTFATPSKKAKSVTQIHVMVNETDTDNAAFFPIINSIPSLMESYTSPGVSIELIGINSNLNQRKEDFEALLQQEKKETIGKIINKKGQTALGSATYALRVMEKEHEIREIGDAESIYEYNKKGLPPILEKLGQTEKIVKDMEAIRAEKKAARDAAEKVYNQKLETGELFKGDDSEDKEKVFDLQKELKEFVTTLNYLIQKRNDLNMQKEIHQIRKNEAMNRLKKYGWSENPGESKYISISERKKLMAHYKTQSLLKEKLKNLIADDEKSLLQYKTDYGEVHIEDSFQLSWLLPQTGGYYMYNGSGLVPPCLKRTYVIVMENPISISTGQLDAILDAFKEDVNINNFPHDRLDISIPIIHPLGDRKVFYNYKNLQYMRDDGIHITSIARRKLKDSEIVISSGNFLSITIYFVTVSISTILLLS